MQSSTGAVCNICQSLCWELNPKCPCGNLGVLFSERLKESLVFVDNPLTITLVKVYHQSKVLVRFTPLSSISMAKPFYMSSETFKKIIKGVDTPEKDLIQG